MKTYQLIFKVSLFLSLVLQAPLARTQEVLSQVKNEDVAHMQKPQQKAKSSAYATAFFDLAASDEELKEIASKVNSFISTLLSTKDSLMLVERAELDKILSEVELGISGTVDPSTAAKIGQLTGAKILVSGKVFRVENKVYAVSKIIGTETGRVFGETESFMFQDSPLEASEKLAEKIAQTISLNGDSLLAREIQVKDVTETLRILLKGKELPRVTVEITERSISRATLDPAAETELSLILSQLGFEVVDPKSADKPAQIKIKGEAFSEFGMRKGNLVSSKGRVEVKAIDSQTGKILAIDREVATAVDLSEEISGKSALQRATRNLAERFIPLIVK